MLVSQIVLDGAEPRNCGDDLVVFSNPQEANWRRQPVTQLACLIRTVAKKVKNNQIVALNQAVLFTTVQHL